MPDPHVFLLPDVGEGLTEADIVAWHVAEGDHVEVNDPLVDVETAKSVVELPSPYAGVVIALHAAAGEAVAVGAPLITVASSSDAGEIEASPTSDSPNSARDFSSGTELASTQTIGPTSEEPGDQPLVLVGTGPKIAGARRIRLSGPPNSAVEFVRTLHTGSELQSGATSPAQRVEKSSVRPRSATQLDGDEHRVRVQGVRKVIAETMVRSAFTAPHASMWTTRDVTRTMDLVRRLRSDRAWADVRVSPMLLAMRAVTLAVREYPAINASWDADTGEIVYHGSVNLGIAAATPRGLLVPNIKQAETLSLRELAVATQELVARARAGKLQTTEMSGGTVTLTNVGTFGVEGATPILNPPEAAILSLGAVNMRPWVEGRTVVPREVMTLAISIDHRLVDGELGANALTCVADLLADPGLSLLRA